MQIRFPMCTVTSVDSFTSKNGTPCASVQWFDMVEGKVYKTMVFGEDTLMLNGLQNGAQCSIVMNVQASRRDSSIELYLAGVHAPDAA